MTQTTTQTPQPQPHTRKLHRSRHDRVISGVCGGIAEHFDVDAGLVRIMLVAATLLGFGSGILIYLACWALLPEEG